MFCSKCGTNNVDSARFCAKCGEPFGASVPEATQKQNLQQQNSQFNAQQQNPQLNSQPQQVSQQNGIRFAPAAGSAIPPPSSGNIQVEKSHSKKPLIIALSSVFGALIIIAVIVVCFLPQIERAVLGDLKYYLYGESKTVENVIDDDFLNAIIPSSSFKATSTITGTAELNGNEGKYTEKGLDTILDTSEIDAEIDYDKDVGKALVKADLKSKNSSILSGRIDVSGSSVGISFPGTVDGQYVIDSSESTSKGTEDAVKVITGYSQDECISVISDVLAQTEKNSDYKKILKDCSVKSKEEVNGKKCTCITYTLTDMQVDDIVDAIGLAASENPDAVEIYKNSINNILVNSSKFSGDDDYETLNTEKAKESLKNDLGNLLYVISDSIVIKICYDNQGNVVSRTFKNDFNNITVDTSFDAGKTDIKVSYIEDGYEKHKVTNTITYSKTLKDGVASGVFKMNYKYSASAFSNTYEVSATYSDAKVVDCGGIKVLTGTISAKWNEDSNYSGDISVTAKSDNNNYTLSGKLNLSEHDEDYSYSANIVSQLSTTPDVSSVSVNSKSSLDFDDDTLEEGMSKVFENAESVYGDAYYQLMGYESKSDYSRYYSYYSYYNF